MFDFGPFFDNIDAILEGFWGTVRLAALSAVLALLIGTILVSFRVAPVPLLRVVGATYVNVVRNTPLGSVLIAMIKNTTVATAASYAEAAAVTKDLLEKPSFTSGALPLFIGVAVGFMILTLPTGFLFGWLHKRMAVAR